MPQLSQSAINELLDLIAERRAACAKVGKSSAGLESVQLAFESLMAKGQGSNLFWVRPAEQERVTAPVIPVLTHVASEGADASPACHVVIEGDNFQVLQVLQHTHSQSLDVIYIDPPYNTNRADFRYNDVWVDKNNKWRHSLWLSFMAKRLSLAKTLLKPAGLLIISIDDNEYANLKHLCDEIFGESQFVGDLIWKSKTTGGHDATNINVVHEHVLIYCRNSPESTVLENRDSGTQYPCFDPITGRNFKWDSLWTVSHGYTENCDYPIATPDGSCVYPWMCHKDGEKVKGVARWFWAKETYERDKHLIQLKQDKKGQWKAYKRVYGGSGVPIQSVLTDIGGTSEGKAELHAIFGKMVFDNPKPTSLIKTLLSRLPNNNTLKVLDFFAGSGTTAQAVMAMNAEDGGTRQCILVTNNEIDKETSSKLSKRGVVEGSSEMAAYGICQAVTWPRVTSVARNFAETANPPRVEYFRLSSVPLSVDSQEDDFRLYGAADKAEARAKAIRDSGSTLVSFSPIAWLEAGAQGGYSASQSLLGHGPGFAVVRNSSELPKNPLVPLRVVYLLTDALVEQPGSSLSAAAARVARKFPTDQKVKVKELWIDYMKNFPVEEK